MTDAATGTFGDGVPTALAPGAPRADPDAPRPLPRSARAARALALAACACFVAYAWWRLGPGAPAPRRGAANGAFYALFCLFPGLACLLAAERRHGTALQAWRLIGCAWLVSCVGAVCWLIALVPSAPAWIATAGTWLYNSYYLFLLAALVPLVARPVGAAAQARVVVESLIVVGACHVLVWYFVVPAVAEGALSAHVASVTITYLGETAVLFAVTLVLQSARVDWPFRVVGVGLLAAAIADLASVRYELAPAAVTGQVTDLMLGISACVVTVAASMAPNQRPRLASMHVGALAGRLLVHLPLVSAGLVPLLLLLELPSAGQPASVVPALAVAATVLGGLVVVRLALALQEVEAEAAARARQDARMLEAVRFEVLGELAGSVAHDFNNILTVLRGGIDELRNGERSDELLEHLDRVTARGAGVCRQLLSFVRRDRTVAETLDLAHLARGMAFVLTRLVAANHRLVITAETGCTYVRGDTTALELVVLNLVVNARDAMPDGGTIDVVVEPLPATVTGPGAASPPWARLMVRDTGCGMDAETQQRALEPLFTTKAPGHGTGLGLATVNRIVGELGGRIHIDTAVGRGTSVSILLPLASPSESAGH